MKKQVRKAALVGSVLVMAMVSSSVALALPPQASAHAQTNANTNGVSQSQPAALPTNGQTHMATGLEKACHNREKAINSIIGRIDTRSQNQLTLFNTIATRVENFYTSKSKTVSSYTQLVAAISAAKTQATNDLGTLQSNSAFSCTASNPKAMVSGFQGYLKTEITDLKNYRTAVKNLIVAVASANGVTVSGANQTNTSQGVKQ